MQNGVEYVVWLDVTSGSAALSVTGQAVSQLDCGVIQGDSGCTFKGNGNGSVTMTVTGGGQGANYLLTFGYP